VSSTTDSARPEDPMVDRRNRRLRRQAKRQDLRDMTKGELLSAKGGGEGGDALGCWQSKGDKGSMEDRHVLCAEWKLVASTAAKQELPDTGAQTSENSSGFWANAHRPGEGGDGAAAMGRKQSGMDASATGVEESKTRDDSSAAGNASSRSDASPLPEPRITLFSVIDGHGGVGASEFVQRRLAPCILGHSAMKVSGLETSVAKSTEKSIAAARTDMARRPAARVSAALRCIDAEFDAWGRHVAHKGKTETVTRELKKVFYSGAATICVAMVDTPKLHPTFSPSLAPIVAPKASMWRRRLVVTNIGDCRAILVCSLRPTKSANESLEDGLQGPSASNVHSYVSGRLGSIGSSQSSRLDGASGKGLSLGPKARA